MKKYYKVMLGNKSAHAADCLANGYIGVNYQIASDLTNDLSDDWQHFNQKYVSAYLERNPEENRKSAEQACDVIWLISKGIQKGDVIVAPNGKGVLHFGIVTTDYHYVQGSDLPHRRNVQWLAPTTRRTKVSAGLRLSLRGQYPYADVSKHSEEIEKYLLNDLSIKENNYDPMDTQFQYLVDTAKSFHQYNESEDSLFRAINDLPETVLQDVLEEYHGPESEFQPVNLVRAEVARQRLLGVIITPALVEEIKEKIRTKSSDYFNVSNRATHIADTIYCI